MICSQFEIEIYHVWVWFSNLLVYAVVTLRLGSAKFDEMVRYCNAHMTHSKVKEIRHTASNVYSYGI
jgi:hypothetical protein